MIEIKECKRGRMMYVANDKWIGKSFHHYGEAFESEINLMSHFVNKGDIVIDAGANMGALTIPLSYMVGEQGHVYAFELQEFIFYVLCGNVALNCYNTTVYNKPLWSSCDKSVYCPSKSLRNDDGVYFYDDLDQHYGGVYLTEEKRFDNDVKILTTTIDHLGLSRLDFIKMDIEGAEVESLKGGYDTIKEHQPIMLIESMPWEAPKIIEYLRSIDYTHHSVRLNYFNENNYVGESHDYLREDFDKDIPMMSSDMVCYPKSRSEELDMKYFKAMKNLK